MRYTNGKRAAPASIVSVVHLASYFSKFISINFCFFLCRPLSFNTTALLLRFTLSLCAPYCPCTLQTSWAEQASLCTVFITFKITSQTWRHVLCDRCFLFIHSIPSVTVVRLGRKCKQKFSRVFPFSCPHSSATNRLLKPIGRFRFWPW